MNKKASVLLYSIILTSIALILSIVVMNNYTNLIINQKNEEIERQLYLSIKENINNITEYLKKTNNDWSWFTDNISCPWYTWNVLFTMSWDTNKADLKSTLFNSWWEIFCSWSYNSNNVIIYFNNAYTWFSQAKYLNETISLNWTDNLDWTFSDLDNTKIIIPKDSYNNNDDIDDNFNNDNYKADTTSISNFEYEDNDNIARKKIKGLVVPWKQKNIFWNNYKIEKFIANNPNNIDNFNVLLGNVGTWYLNLEVNWDLTLTLIKVDKSKYINFNEIKKIETFTWAISSWSWYIKLNWNNLELDNDITNAYKFDFKNSDYLLFLTNNTNNIINYSLFGKTDNWKWIYINPIDDSNSNNEWFYILWYDAIINKEWNIIWKIIKLEQKK